MLFRKLKIDKTPEHPNGTESWSMILRTVEDVVLYSQLEGELTVQAYMALPDSITKSHLEGARERILSIMIQTRLDKAKEGEQIYGIDVINELVSNKAKNMLKMIAKGDEVKVNQKGGYCDYAGFMKIWNAIVTDEIEMDGCYFPVDMQPIETDILYIENGERVPVEFERAVDKMFNYSYGSHSGWDFFNENINGKKDIVTSKEAGKKIKYKLTQLKFKDPKYIAALISKAKVIAFESQLADDIQINKMFELFSQLRGKHIIISTTYPDKIMNHSLWTKCIREHNIEFI